VATRPRRHRDRGAHGEAGRWPQRHPRRRCRARDRPDPVTRDRASRHRHLPMPDPRLLWALLYQDRCPASELTQPAGGQAAWPSAGAWLPGSWEALFKGSGSDLRDRRW